MEDRQIFDQQIEVAYQRLHELMEQSGGSPEQQGILRGALEALSTSLEELHVAGEELCQHNEELATAQQLVEAERQRYQDLFEFTPDGCLVTDANGIIREANRAAADLLHVSRGHLIGKALATYVTPEDRHPFRLQLADLVRAGRVVDWEVRLKPHKVPPFPASLAVAVVRDSQGRAMGLCWQVRDITQRKRTEEEVKKQNEDLERRVSERTSRLEALNQDLQNEIAERKRAEEALRESEERYKRLLGSVTDYIYTVKVEDGRPAAAFHGPGWAALTGYTPAEYEADPYLWYRMVYDEDRPAVVKQAAMVLSGQAALPLEHRIVHRDGSIRWVRNTPVPHYDESQRLVAYDGLIADITERKQAEQALRESEEKFRTFIEQSSEAVMLLDEQGDVIEWNRASEEITGLKRDEVVGQPARDVQFRSAIPERRTPEIHESNKAMTLEALRTGQAPFFQHIIENELQKPNGERRIMEQVVFPIKTAQGYRIGIISRDVTDRRRAEEEAQRRAENLAAINELAIRCAAALPDTDLFELVAGKLRSITGALAVAISTYDAKSGDLTVRHLAIRGQILSRLNKLLGRNAIGMRIPVSPGMLERILAEEVGIATDLSETTFGAVPKPIAAAVQKALDIGSFTGLALTYGDELVGTAVIVMRTGQPSLPADVAKTFANVAAVSLRRKRADEALQESEEKFRTFIEQSSEAVTLVDEQGTVIECNQACQKITGLKRDEVVGQSSWNMQFRLLVPEWQTPEMYESHKAATLEALRTGQSPFFGRIMEYEFQKPDGERRHMEQIIFPIKTSKGYRIGIISRDVTDRKRVEEERERLLEQVRAGQEQLRNLAGYLQAAREAERTYIAREIHDEFGQMLTALKMDLAWLARQLPDDKSRLAEKARAMSGLLDATLETVRRVAAELRPGLLDDLGLIEALQWQAQEFAERTGIECEVHQGEEEIALGRDLDTAIFRIVQEALTNVARHAGATRVRLELEARPDRWVLTVHDNGRGITDGQLADPKSLGLMGMCERARAWGGDITFQGIPGEGTTVSVYIPKQAARKDAP